MQYVVICTDRSDIHGRIPTAVYGPFADRKDAAMFASDERQRCVDRSGGESVDMILPLIAMRREWTPIPASGSGLATCGIPTWKFREMAGLQERGES